MSHCAEFLRRHGLTDPPCGCDVGIGWISLLDRLVTDLKALGWDGDLQQVKEKFAGLRFYIGDGSDAIHDRIHAAEMESFKICEHCGALGSLRRRSWLKTLCDACAEKR